MRTTISPRRILIAAVALGLGAGGLSGLGTPSLEAAVSEAARGHGHAEPDGSLFCHCTGHFCHPCASTEVETQ